MIFGQRKCLPMQNNDIWLQNHFSLSLIDYDLFASALSKNRMDGMFQMMDPLAIMLFSKH